jgi:hypothetical protein
MEISIKEFAKLRGKSPARVRQLIGEGRIPFRRFGEVGKLIDDKTPWPEEQQRGPKATATK